VERNAARAGLVTLAEDWVWSSLHALTTGDVSSAIPLHVGPVPRPAGWTAWVNEPLTEAELEAVRRSAARGSPFGA
jgi:putative transposase